MTSFETGKGGTFARFILAKRESKKKSTASGGYAPLVPG